MPSTQKLKTVFIFQGSNLVQGLRGSAFISVFQESSIKVQIRVEDKTLYSIHDVIFKPALNFCFINVTHNMDETGVVPGLKFCTKYSFTELVLNHPEQNCY